MELAISLNNQQFELAGPFTFYGDSIFESMVPLSGPDLGGTRVVIRGPNLAPGLAPELLTLTLTLNLTLTLTLALTLTLTLTLTRPRSGAARGGTGRRAPVLLPLRPEPQGARLLLRRRGPRVRLAAVDERRPGRAGLASP